MIASNSISILSAASQKRSSEMKVLVISNLYPSRGRDDGVFVKNQVDCLRRTFKVGIITVVRKGLSSWAYLPFWIRNFVFLLFRKYDLIHAHYGFHSALLATIVKRKPVVITFHGSDVLKEPSRNKIYRKLQEFVVSRSDYIIAVSDEVRNVLVSSLGADPSKISVISCGVDTLIFAPQPKMDIRSQLEIGRDQKVVLFIGRLDHNKGIDIISECARRMPNVSFVLVGVGPLRADAENCRCVGACPNSEIPVWTNAADVLLLPSRSEGSPVVLKEALSCGVPVVASKIGGIPELVKDGETGYLVEAEDVDMFEERLRKLLDNPQKRRQMGQKGREHMMENYDSRNIAQRIKQVYEKVLASSQSTRSRSCWRR